MSKATGGGKPFNIFRYWAYVRLFDKILLGMGTHAKKTTESVEKLLKATSEQRKLAVAQSLMITISYVKQNRTAKEMTKSFEKLNKAQKSVIAGSTNYLKALSKIGTRSSKSLAKGDFNLAAKQILGKSKSYKNISKHGNLWWYNEMNAQGKKFTTQIRNETAALYKFVNEFQDSFSKILKEDVKVAEELAEQIEVVSNRKASTRLKRIGYRIGDDIGEILGEGLIGKIYHNLWSGFRWEQLGRNRNIKKGIRAGRKTPPKGGPPPAIGGFGVPSFGNVGGSVDSRDLIRNGLTAFIKEAKDLTDRARHLKVRAMSKQPYKTMFPNVEKDLYKTKPHPIGTPVFDERKRKIREKRAEHLAKFPRNIAAVEKAVETITPVIEKIKEVTSPYKGTHEKPKGFLELPFGKSMGGPMADAFGKFSTHETKEYLEELVGDILSLGFKLTKDVLKKAPEDIVSKAQVFNTEDFKYEKPEEKKFEKFHTAGRTVEEFGKMASIPEKWTKVSDIHTLKRNITEVGRLNADVPMEFKNFPVRLDDAVRFFGNGKEDIAINKLTEALGMLTPYNKFPEINKLSSWIKDIIDGIDRYVKSGKKETFKKGTDYKWLRVNNPTQMVQLHQGEIFKVIPKKDAPKLGGGSTTNKKKFNTGTMTPNLDEYYKLREMIFKYIQRGEKLNPSDYLKFNRISPAGIPETITDEKGKLIINPSFNDVIKGIIEKHIESRKEMGFGYQVGASELPGRPGSVPPLWIDALADMWNEGKMKLEDLVKSFIYFIARPEGKDLFDKEWSNKEAGIKWYKNGTIGGSSAFSVVPSFQEGTDVEGMRFLLAKQIAKEKGPGYLAGWLAEQGLVRRQIKENEFFGAIRKTLQERKQMKVAAIAHGGAGIGFGPELPTVGGALKQRYFTKQGREAAETERYAEAEQGVQRRGLLGDVVNQMFKPAINVFQGFKRVVNTVIDPLEKRFPKLSKTFNGIMKATGYFGLVKLIEIGQMLWQVMNPFQVIMQSLQEIFSVYGEILSASFMPLIQKLFEVFFGDTAMKLITTLADLFLKLAEALMPIVDALMPAFYGILEGLQPIIGAITEIMTPLLPIFTMLGNIFGQIFSALGPVIGILIKALVPALRVFGFVMWLLGNAVIAIMKAIIGIVNFFRVAAGKEKLEQPQFVARPNMGGGVTGTQGVETYQHGGIAREPTLALIGERRPEGVVPLDAYGNIERGKEGLVGTSYGNGGGVVLNVYGDIRGKHNVADITQELWLYEVRNKRRFR